MASDLIGAFRAEAAQDLALLPLVANEGVMSLTARSAFNCSLNDRYFNGPGDTQTGGTYNTFTPFTSRGYPAAAALIEAGKSVVKRRLGAEHVEFSPLSGINAMLLALIIATEPGDVVATIPVANGGHFGTAAVLQSTGRRRVDLPMLDATTRIDLDALRVTNQVHAPTAIYLDSSFILEPHDVGGVREIVGPDVTIIYDASHTVGLMLGHQFQSPLHEGADIVTANTHKTLHGPQKGLLAFRSASRGASFSDEISSGLLSSTHFSALAALAITLLELDEHGSALAADCIRNANDLAHQFASLGYQLRYTSSGSATCSHQAHVFVDTDQDYQEIYGRFFASDIAANFDNALGGRLYLRLGAQSLTRRGMGAAEMSQVAGLVDRVLKGEVVGGEVHALTAQFSTVKYSFDEDLGQEENVDRQSL